MDKITDGLKKIEEMKSKPGETVTESPKPEEIKTESNEPEEIDQPTYESMVAAMRLFIQKDRNVRIFRLTMYEQIKDNYLIYRALRSDPWAWLRPFRCQFAHTELLAAIKRLPEDHILFRYFKDYGLDGRMK